MSKLGELLGSETRAKIIVSLAAGEGSLTAYALAKENGANISKVYLEMKRLYRLGVVNSAGKGRGVAYSLADEDIRRLARKYSARVVGYGDWSSGRAKARRFRMGFAQVPPYVRAKGTGPLTKPTRSEGELDALAELGRRRFDAKYAKTSERGYARV